MKRIFHIIIFLWGACSVYAMPPAKNVARHILIYGEIYTDVPVDTVTLTYYDNFTEEGTTIPQPLTLQTKTTRGGMEAYGAYIFRFTIPDVSKPGYITIRYGKQGCPMHLYLTEPGDSVMMQIDQHRGSIVFAGPAAGKFRCQYEMDRAKANHLFGKDVVIKTSRPGQMFKTDSSRIAFEKRQQSKFGKRLAVEVTNRMQEVQEIAGDIASCHWQQLPEWKMLEQFRGRVPASFYQVLQSNLVGAYLATAVGKLRRTYQQAITEKDTALVALARKVYYEQVKELPTDHINANAIYHSRTYPVYVIQKSYCEEIFEQKRTLYQVIKNELHGPVRDKVVATYLLTWHKMIADIDGLLQDAFTYVAADMREPLQTLYSRLAKGVKAPDFELEDTNGKKVRLHDFLGKIVFIDFWFTGCSACISFYKGTLSKIEAHFRDRSEFVMLTISADNDRNRWLKSVNSGSYTSPHSSINLFTGASGGAGGYLSKHAVLTHFNVYSYPYQIMIDREGRIYRSGDLRQPAEELVELIEEALAVGSK